MVWEFGCVVSPYQKLFIINWQAGVFKGELFMQNNVVQHVFLIGAKSLGAYGGYETFINKLTEYHQNNDRIKYHVACKANGDGSMDPYTTKGAKIISEQEFIYNNAHCFRIKIPQSLGAAQAIYYDITALKECCNIIENKHLSHPIVYILACRIGPFLGHYFKKIHKLGGRVFLNPDGHEWMRAKWSVPVRKYWKLSEQLMVRYCDLVICDSISIEKYIHKCYDGKCIKGGNPQTAFIAYGAETQRSKLSDNDPTILEWYKMRGLRANEYYLVVGRFVPENSYETMIREYMKSSSKKDLAIITTENEAYAHRLEEKLGYKDDPRVKFVGTVYDQELLKKIRENAFGYLHGHTVGGTNPSLIEALGSTDLNLLVDVEFNREVAAEGALYWGFDNGELCRLIDQVDKLPAEAIAALGIKAKKRVREEYTWQKIADKYKRLWLTGKV